MANNEAGDGSDPPNNAQNAQIPPNSPTVNKDSLELAAEVATRLEAKKQELLEIEKGIDKKINDFKSFVEATKLEGRAVAGPAAAPKQQTESEKQDAFIKATFEAVGMKAPI